MSSCLLWTKASMATFTKKINYNLHLTWQEAKEIQME